MDRANKHIRSILLSLVSISCMLAPADSQQEPKQLGEDSVMSSGFTLGQLKSAHFDIATHQIQEFIKLGEIFERVTGRKIGECRPIDT